jgi:hypothetical protein
MSQNWRSTKFIGCKSRKLGRGVCMIVPHRGLGPRQGELHALPICRTPQRPFWDGLIVDACVPEHPPARVTIPCFADRQKVGTAECSSTAPEVRSCRALDLHLHDLLRSSAKQQSPSFDLHNGVHSWSQYVTRPPLWHTKRTPPSWEITTATDLGSAPHKR